MFVPKFLRDRLDRIITLDGISLTSGLSVRNIGVTSDRDLSFIRLIEGEFWQNIANIRKLLTLLTRCCPCICYLQAGLLSEFPNKPLRSFQLNQNAAARIVTGTGKTDHMTHMLASHHWMPIKSRIDF